MTSLEDGDKDGRIRSDFMIELTYILINNFLVKTLILMK